MTCRIFRSLLLLSAAIVFWPAAAMAQTTYYWDNNGASAGFGTAAGTWTVPTVGDATQGWSTSAAGILVPNSVTTTTSDSLNFGNSGLGLAAGTIAVTGTVDAGNLIFASGSGAITLSSGAINLAATSTLTVNNATNTISSTLTGAATSLTKAGTGILVLSGVNTYAGATIINAGTLTLNRQTGSLAATALTFSGTGTFNMDNTVATGVLSQTLGALTFSAGDGTVRTTRTAAFDQTITFASLAARTAGATGNFVNTGTNSAANGFIFTTAPTASQIMDRGLFYNGSSYAAYDSLGFVRGLIYGTDTNANASLSGTAVTDLGSIGATKDTQFVGAARATTTSGAASGTATPTLVVTNGALFAVGQAITGTNVPANAFIIAISGNTLTLSTNIITAVAAATTLTPYNSVTAQTTGSANTLNLSGVGSSLTLAASQTLSVNGILRSAGTSGVVGAISGGTGIQTVISGGDLVIRTNVANDTLDIRSAILNNGSSSLTKTGAGTLVLSGANTYAGGTAISGGTVVISSATGFGTGNISVTGSSRINATGGLTYANALTVGAALILQNPTTTATTATFSGILSGGSDITLVNNGTNNNNAILAFTNVANTFTGNVILPTAGSGNDYFSFNSLGDAGNFTIQKNGNREGIIYAGSSNIVFNTRQITLGTTFTGATGLDGNGNPINTFQNNGTGTVTFNSNLGITTITGSSFFWFGGSNTGNNTFAGILANPTNAFNLSIAKTDAGRWIFTGANTFAGITLIAQGTLSVNAISNIANAQPLGRGTLVQLGRVATNGILEFTGSTNSTTDRQVQIGDATAANAGGGSILNNGTGSLTFTNAAFNPAIASITATRTLTLGGTYNGSNEIQGILQNNAAGGLVTLTVSGSTWNLSGANIYTGATLVSAGTLVISGSPTGNSATTVTGGTLSLDYSINNTSKIGDSAILTFGGGTINLIGGTHTEAVASTTLTTNTVSAVTRSSGTSVLQLGAITRGAGAIISFGADGIASTSTTNTNGILGAWATIAGTDWATNSTNAANGPITTYAAYTDVPRLTPGTIADGSATNVRLVEGSGTAGSILLAAATTTINSLNQSISGGTSAATIDPAGQILSTNGILVGPGAGDLTLGTGTNNGTLMTATAGGELVLTNNSVNTLTINSLIANNTSASSLIKAGPGTVILTNANTYTGGTLISGGTLQLGTGGTGGALTGTSTVTIGTGATFVVNRSNTAVQGTDFGSAAISGGGGITQAGTGTLTLSAANTYSGMTLINAGIVKIGNATALGAQTGTADGTIISSGATLDLNGVVATNTGTVGERITVSGTGVAGQGGAITSSALIASPFIGVRFLTLAGNTTLNSDFRWDVGSGTGGVTSSLTGAGFTLNLGTLTPASSGSNLRTFSLNFLGDTGLGDINVNLGAAIPASGTGTLFLQGTTTLGVAANTLSITGGTVLDLFTNVSIATFDKKIALDNAAIRSRRAAGVTFSGTILLTNANIIATDAPVSATGVISGTGSLVKGIQTGGGTGASTLTLSAANTFSGTTTVATGILILTNSLALQNSPLDTLNSVTGTTTAGLRTSTTTVTLGGLIGNKDLASAYTTTTGGYGSVTALTLNPVTGATPSYSAVIADGAAGMQVFKTGPGTQTLSGANTYTGGTVITAGTLAADTAGPNSATGTAAVTVNAGTLRGIGNIAGAITLSGGTIAPGDATNAGVLTSATTPILMTGGFTFSVSGGLVNSSQLNITGTGTLALGTVLTLAVTPYTGGTNPDHFTLIASAGTSVTGQFFNYPEGTLVFSNGGTDFRIHYGSLNSEVGVFLATTAVPEPMGLGLVAIASLGVLFRRRRTTLS